MRVKACAGCGGTMRIIACIEDPVVIKAILAHLADKARPVHAPPRPATSKKIPRMSPKPELTVTII